MISETAVEEAPKLLVIDDDKGVTDLFKMIAQELQFEFHCVHEFDDITDAYKSISPDIIFLDLKLPGHDGVEVLQLLSRLGCKTKIYIVSGLDQSTLESAGALGRLDHLNIVGTLKKPFLIDDVERMLLQETNSSSSFTSEALQELFGPGEFRLYFQPGIVLQQSDRLSISDLEISAQWSSQSGDATIPDWLIMRKLENSGSAIEHSKALLRQALESHASFNNKYPCGLYYRPHSHLFSDSDFPLFITEICEQSDIPPSKLTLGIHENDMLSDSQDILNVVTRLRINGFNISVEISSTETNQLDALLHLPVNELRLCPELIATITRSVDAEFEISTLISACNKRDIATRADGITNEKLLRFLVDCGCTTGQGKHISRPLAHHDLDEFVEQLRNSPDASRNRHASNSG